MLERDSDFDEFAISVEDEALFHLLASQLDHNESSASPAVESISASQVRVSKHVVSSPRAQLSPSGPRTTLVACRRTSATQDTPGNPTQPGNLGRDAERQRVEETEEEKADRLINDGRSPIERFRTGRKRTLNVTDLTSGQWCELQYEYTLTKLPFGRKVSTEAMKGGTKVHKKLERQVHVPVEVSVTTREDGFGLRLWNIVQGLRTLRETGLTRELEVWGLVEGYVVTGVVDQLHVEYSENGESEGDPEQSKIAEHFSSSQPFTQHQDDKIFLTDIKTISAKRKPSGGALRPTKVQLYLYYRFICDIADGKLDLLKVFERYRVDPDAVFSDSYLAQISEIHPEIFDEPVPVASGQRADSPADARVRYRTLREMVPLYQDEVQRTFPRGSKGIETQATVEYRSREDGEIAGTRVFELDRDEIQPCVDKYMEWWRGKRPAEGVPIEEAYKCRICDFAESCTWREAIDQASLSRTMERLARMKAKAEEDGRMPH